MSRRPKPAIRLIATTDKVWPKSTSVRDLPTETRRQLANYLSLVEPSCPFSTNEGLFGAANILNRAGLSFNDLARHVYDETTEGRLAA